MKSQVYLDAAYAPSEEIVARELVGELVIVPLTAEVGDLEDALYSLNETGRAIWDRLDGVKSLRDVAAELTEAYDAPSQEIERDVIGLVGELLARSMLVEVPSA
jgi:hypothetical protein